MSEVRLIDANALKANLPEPTTIKQYWVYRTLCDFIDNAPTISPYKALHDELNKGEE